MTAPTLIIKQPWIYNWSHRILNQFYTNNNAKQKRARRAKIVGMHLAAVMLRIANGAEIQ